jgi:SAM-dependent methyltransferase
MYYRNKIESLQSLFGTSDLEVKEKSLRVRDREYAIIDDVIDLLGDRGAASPPLAGDIQYTFGAEWQEHRDILPEHAAEFAQYFDLVDLASLKKARVLDLGCGSGRWSYHLKDRVRELVLVDFSEAIHVARYNLREAPGCLFFKGDITALPFATDAADLVICLGVLHHLPVPCLTAVRQLKKYAPRLLIFLYYALDNRPLYFRALLGLVTAVRQVLARIHAPWFRALFVYLPLVALGKLLSAAGLGSAIPLYDFYRNKSLKRIRQDVYDRFFTRIEQRVTRAEILGLQSDFSAVTVSDHLPYWHFLLSR